MVSSWLLLLVSVGYAALLFGVAWWGDRRPMYPDRPWLRPVVYSLALAVYLVFLNPGERPLYLNLVYAIGGGIVGSYLPMILLKNNTTKRQFSIKRAWPDCLDLLLLCVEMILVYLVGVGPDVEAWIGWVPFAHGWIFKGTEQAIGRGYAWFLVNAIVGLLLTLFLFWVFMAIGLHYLVARVIASVFAGLSVFLLNAVLNFRSV